MPPKKAAAKKPWVKYTQWDSDRVYYWNSRTDVYTLKEPDEGHEETVDEDDADGFEEEYTKAERFDAGELRSATLPSGARVAVSNKTAAGPPSPSPSAAAAKVSVLLIGDGAEDATVRADDPGLAAEGFETCIVPTMLGVPLVIKKLKRPRCAKVDPLDERNLLVQLLMMSPKDGSAPDVRPPAPPSPLPCAWSAAEARGCVAQSWQTLGKGAALVKRTDHQPFGLDELAPLEVYLYEVLLSAFRNNEDASRHMTATMYTAFCERPPDVGAERPPPGGPVVSDWNRLTPEQQARPLHRRPLPAVAKRGVD